MFKFSQLNFSYIKDDPIIRIETSIILFHFGIYCIFTHQQPVLARIDFLRSYKDIYLSFIA